jgi:hypothetical protein
MTRAKFEFLRKGDAVFLEEIRNASTTRSGKPLPCYCR